MCDGPPALLGWATGNLPEPPNNPQVGMANMRTLMPSLQKARPAALTSKDIGWKSAALPKVMRETRIVKDVPAEKIAEELYAWVGGR